MTRKPKAADADTVQELRRKLRPLLKVKFPPPLDEMAKSAPPLSPEQQESLQNIAAGLEPGEVW